MTIASDVTSPEDLAIVAANMRSLAGESETGPDLAAALNHAASKIEHFCAIAADCVAEIEQAIELLADAFNRIALH